MDENWLKQYQTFVFDSITILAVPSTTDNFIDIRRKLVGQEAMVYWVRVVKHGSLEPNNDSNYETLEKLGDTAMKLTYERIVIELYPNVDEETLTNLTAAQVWRDQQATFSDQIGLGNWLQSIVVINKHIREDLLEAMFGALFLIGDKILGPGNGIIMCQNATNSLYKEIIQKLDLTTFSRTSGKIAKNPQQKLKEIGDKLGWYSGVPTIEEFGVPTQIKDRFGQVTAWQVTYRLTPKAIKWLNTQGMAVVNNGILAQAKDKDKDKVRQIIVERALKSLKELYDIDWEFANKGRKKVLTPSVLKQMSKDKVDDIIIVKDKHSEYYQLVGINTEGRKEILLTVSNETNSTTKGFQNEIYNVYVTNGKQPLGTVIRIQ